MAVHTLADPNARLTRALEHLYVGPSLFPASFREDPETTLAHFLVEPDDFGQLRTYIGPLGIARAITEVRVAARQVMRASQLPPVA